MYINLREFTRDGYSTNFILGARGVGKTVSAFNQAIKHTAKTGEAFVYLRRYETELETLVLDIPLLRELNPKYNIERKKETLEGATSPSDVLLVDGVVSVFFIALSTASKVKSTNFSKVYEVDYDEFIDIRGKELANETTLFLEFMKTVFRDSRRYRVVFLANATNIYNNYFLDFEIMPSKRVTKFKDKNIKIVMYKTDAELAERENNTDLAGLIRLVEGEENSTLNNTFDNGFNDFLTKLDGRSKTELIIKHLNTNYYLYRTNSKWIISDRGNANIKDRLALTVDDISENYPLMNNELYGTLRENFTLNNLYFTDVKTRSRFIRTLIRKSQYTSN